VEVVASISQGRTAAAQCGLFTHKSVPVIFEPPCIKLHQCIKCNTEDPNQITRDVWNLKWEVRRTRLDTPRIILV